MGSGRNINSHIDTGRSKGRMNIIKTHEEITGEFEDRLIDWCTFYRRNIHRFVEHYLGIKLYLYQKIMLYLMNLCPTVVLLCSRAVGKWFAHIKPRSNRWNLSKLIIDNTKKLW